MDLLYLRIYAMLVFEIFIFAVLQVPINFDGEPISVALPVMEFQDQGYKIRKVLA